MFLYISAYVGLCPRPILVLHGLAPEWATICSYFVIRMQFIKICLLFRSPSRTKQIMDTLLCVCSLYPLSKLIICTTTITEATGSHSIDDWIDWPITKEGYTYMSCTSFVCVVRAHCAKFSELFALKLDPGLVRQHH